jgi:hypothetical protein
MGSIGKDEDPSTGSGDGGTLGTPTTDNIEDVPSNDGDRMVVSGGGVADSSHADRDGAARPGPRRAGADGRGPMRTPTIAVGLLILAAFVLLMYLLG